MHVRFLPSPLARIFAGVISVALSITAHADPQLTSWFTANSGKYARIYTSTANETAGTTSISASSSSPWSRGSGTQTNPAYADVNEINHSASWVYIRTSGLASHIMGPWYLNAAKTTDFPNFPSNTATIYRIPRVPAVPGTKSLTGLGVIGRFVNGVSFFDNRDAFSYVNGGTEANPGDGIWNRDAYVNESVTFDPALAHQAGNNYHYHVHPIALRFQLGDHVSYNSTTNRYTEAVTAPAHSPIIAWAADGYPVYGPYGYSDPNNAASGVRRMVSGYVPRDGANGTANLSTTGRTTLPAWAAVAQNNRSTTLLSTEYGPAVSGTRPLGRYIEDNDYLGDLGFTQTTGATVRDFDLDQYNGRMCVTPEFPNPPGTYAYFSTIKPDGTPAYPYNIGRQFYGNPTGGARTAAQMNADTPLTQQFLGGPSKPLTISTPNVTNNIVTLTWSAIEGGTYSVDASPNNNNPWTNKATGIVSTGISANSSYTALATSSTEYGRVNRTAIATYDTNGYATATVAQTATASYPVTPNTPPTITSISPVTTMRNNTTSAIAFTIGDAETAAASLTVTATSSNTALVPNANITFAGSGTSRTVMVTPASGQVGTATITVTVNDGTTTTSTTFIITVQPPNILIIIADDFGLDATSVFNSSAGASLPATPNIATLASGGVKFTHAYTYTVCSPSRSSVLTGRYGFRTGTANVAGGTASNNSLKSTEFTLPDAFAANSALGYQLKHIGKWHLGGGNTAPVTTGGWPSFSGSLAGQISDYYSWPKVVTDGTTTIASTSTTYATTDQVNDAVSFINTQTTAGKPWVTWLAFNAPHIISVSPSYQKPPTNLIVTPAYAALSGTSADILANPHNYFNATIEAMDTEIGRLLQSVDLTKTNVIFIGDNGTAPGVLQTPYSANHGKATLYEGAIRVPLIIAGPDVVTPNRTSDVLTHFVDLYSTVLELAGINVASTVPGGTVLDSQSLLPVLQNPAQTTFRSQVFGDYFDLAFPTLASTGRVLRDSQYKLIRYNFGLGADEFYDVLNDPYEATNLLAGGVGAMTAARQTAYNNLVTQLASFNTAPTVSAIANQSIAPNTATGAIAFTIGDAESASTVNLGVTATSSNQTLVPDANVVIGGTAPGKTLTITPATGQTGTATITVSVSDGTFSTSTSFVLTVAVSGSPTITAITTSPAAPTNTDIVTVTANVQPLGVRTLAAGNVVLSYTAGTSSQNTVFTETMASAAITTWTGTGTNNAWTITFPSGGPPNPFSQTTAANHGAGNTNGMEINRGSPTLGQSAITTTSAINAVGTAGYVEFYISTAALTGTNGWAFQTSTNGTAWTTRISEVSGGNHDYTVKADTTAQPYHYDLTAAERVNTLMLRFQFAGSGPNGAASKMSLDDIKVVTTNTPTPVNVTMTGLSTGGTFTAQIPAQATGTVVNYTITATDSAAGVTTSASNNYTVAAAAPVLAVTPAGALASSGPVGGIFSPASAGYTLTNSGVGTMNWTAGKTAAWLNLSATGGTLAAGASTTVTATINSAANSLAVGDYSDTITFTNTSNGSGNTTRPASLAVLSPVQNWRLTWYGTTSNSGNAASLADTYHTGIPNLAAFAFFGPGQDPATANIALLPQPVLGGGICTFTFTQPAGVSGVIYGAQWSTTMLANDWHDITDTGSGSEHIFSIALVANTNLFVRLAVTEP